MDGFTVLGAFTGSPATEASASCNAYGSVGRRPTSERGRGVLDVGAAG